MYKDPPMELLDSRFNAATLRQLNVPDLTVLRRKAESSASSLIEIYATELDPEDKFSVMIQLGAKCLKLFEKIHNDCDEVVPGLSVFLAEVARCWGAGIKGRRSAFSWMDINWDLDWQNVYVPKAMRHLSIAEDPSVPLKERIEHAAAVYCNANILWHHCGCNDEETDESV